jgi:H+/Cl- antiporter ClcA
VLEMTDRHSVIFYLMLAGLASYAGAWLVNRQSLYDKLKALYLRDAIPK